MYTAILFYNAGPMKYSSFRLEHLSTLHLLRVKLKIHSGQIKDIGHFVSQFFSGMIGHRDETTLRSLFLSRHN